MHQQEGFAYAQLLTTVESTAAKSLCVKPPVSTPLCVARHLEYFAQTRNAVFYIPNKVKMPDEQAGFKNETTAYHDVSLDSYERYERTDRPRLHDAVESVGSLYLHTLRAPRNGRF